MAAETFEVKDRVFDRCVELEEKRAELFVIILSVNV